MSGAENLGVNIASGSSPAGDFAFPAGELPSDGPEAPEHGVSGDVLESPRSEAFADPPGAETPDVVEPGAGDEPEPWWARSVLAVLLVVTAVGYLWDLSRNGWGNTFYAAAVQAGTHSWSSLFYGSFDWGNYITVDKPPASLWIMALSGRIFGFSSWSMLAPEALLGVASVGLMYGAVRRVWGSVAGLVAAALLAITPAAALMFRFNNPDAALTFLLVAAAYALTRAVRAGHTGWLLAAGALVGTAFLAKSLQAFLVVPGLAMAYLACAPGRWLRRLWQLLAAGAVMVVGGLWWPVLVDLIPADKRPYIGGSTTNSVLELAFGYNGLGRITGSEGGPGGGGARGGGGGPGAGFSGATGWGRLFNDLFAGFIAWFLPAALIGVVAAVWLLRRKRRTDPRWASLLLWGGWTLVTAGVFSFASGIIHTYYSVALAPGVAALAAMPLPALWRQRSRLVARLLLAASTAATAVTGFVLLGHASGWYPWLRWSVLVLGVAGAVMLVVPPVVGRLRIPAPAVAVAASAALVAGIAGPTAWSLATIGSTHTGSVPDVGPAQARSRGGFPGMRWFDDGRRAAGENGAGGFPPGFVPGGQQTSGQQAGGQQAGGQQPGGQQPGGQQPGGQQPGGQQPGGQQPGGQQPGSAQGGTPPGGGGFGGGPGGMRGEGGADAELTTLLKAGASGYRWVAAASSSQTAGPLQLAANAPVMSLGGFSGGDAAITLDRFKALVAQGKVHYFIADGFGGRGGFGGWQGAFPGGTPGNGQAGNDGRATGGDERTGAGAQGFGGGAGGGFGGPGGRGVISSISEWVSSAFTATTVGSATVYDLTKPTTGSTTSS